EMVRREPKNAEAYQGLAWLLATCPDPRVRDGKKAVENATRACELTKWTDPNPISALAAAHAEVGEFAKAAEYQKKALALPVIGRGENADAGFDRDQAQARLKLYESGKAYRVNG